MFFLRGTNFHTNTKRKVKIIPLINTGSDTKFPFVTFSLWVNVFRFKRFVLRGDFQEHYRVNLALPVPGKYLPAERSACTVTHVHNNYFEKKSLLFYAAICKRYEVPPGSREGVGAKQRKLLFWRSIPCRAHINRR
jgi:hypothetical protein